MNRILILFLIISSQLYSQNQTMEKINYNDLNSKQKENYNYHKVAAALADYGYDSMRLNNDWQGADFIAGFISSFFRNNQSNIPILLVCNYNLMIINRSLN